MPGEGRRWDAAALLGQVDIIADACICLLEKMRVGQLKNEIPETLNSPARFKPPPPGFVSVMLK
jgi:hypothetical protein